MKALLNTKFGTPEAKGEKNNKKLQQNGKKFKRQYQHDEAFICENYCAAGLKCFYIDTDKMNPAAMCPDTYESLTAEEVEGYSENDVGVF